ncbi:hypothetical protein [Rickettsiales endosymbiont of Stachyamoeba lipophora]|uniref:hypothetical protein n=1 Tax=Rickettsiales endosymbiont of Stachyamoeba lipophora TaxID=2486578 RepID=UPI0019CF518B|nr:hypothetical protein [Rickettsiales endosymbiont of Stachyamoeba lipophora]
MVTILAAFTGFFSSLLPHLIGHFKDLSDKKQELEIFDRQIKLQKLGLSQRIEEIKLIDQTLELKEIYKTYYTKIKWIDALNGLVRPVLAYAFFGLYCFIKYWQTLKLGINSVDPEIIEILWNVEDQAIFTGIISFYFGQRAMSKLNKK